jgi:hypothetical protein
VSGRVRLEESHDFDFEADSYTVDGVKFRKLDHPHFLFKTQDGCYEMLIRLQMENFDRDLHGSEDGDLVVCIVTDGLHGLTELERELVSYPFDESDVRMAVRKLIPEYRRLRQSAQGRR